jgi:DNA-binding CsgD family transcriptional regulator
MAVRMAKPAACRLREREAELRVTSSVLERSRSGSGSLVLIEGEPGIGKSSLMSCMGDHAAELGFRTLRSRGSELERSYPYAVTVDLLAPLVRDLGGVDGLDGAAAMARSLFEPKAHGSAADALAILNGLAWLLFDAAEREPLLLLVDDAQWADEPSLRFLHYLGRRVGDHRIAIALASRRGEPDTPEELGLLADVEGAVLVRPEGLSRDGVASVIADELGAVQPALVERWHVATRGNPFYLTELARECLAGDGEPEPASGQVPDAVRRSIVRRLRRLGDDAVALAVATAVLGDGCQLPTAAAVAELESRAAAEVAARLADAWILQRTDRLAFEHPIVQAAVVSTASAIELKRLHGEAARRLAAEGRPPEAVASHLLRAERGANPWTVDRLEEAAAAAIARGTPRAAAGYLARAIEEPPPPYRRTSVLIALARAESAAGMASEGVAHFSEALAEMPAGPERAALRGELGLALMRTAHWGEAASEFQEGLDELGAASPALAADLHAGFVSASLMAAQPTDEVARRLSDILAGPIDTPSERHLACSVAFQRSAFVMGDHEEQVALVRRALDGASTRDLLAAGQAVELAAGVLLTADVLADELSLLTAAMADARDSGQLGRYCTVSYCRAWPNYFAGHLAAAAADAEAAVNALSLGWQTFYPAACGALAMALVEMGDLERAEAVLALDPHRWGETLDYQFIVPIARGKILLASGRPGEAAVALAGADEVAARQNIRSPVILSWRAPYARALALAGERERARAVASEEIKIADEWGAPRARGVARHAMGMVLGGRDGLAHLREAREILSASPSALELLRVDVDLGAALRRAGRLTEAREVLAGALDTAHRFGAVALRDVARSELAASGARPRRAALTGPESLTPAELRVARMAAAGSSNREIAQALFVTPKAVEFHLANAYRKLQIGTRRELSAALPDDEPVAAGKGT